MKWAVLLPIFLILSSCTWIGSQRGGESTVIREKTTTTTEPDGTVIVTNEKDVFDVEQPESPKNAAIIKVSRDGNIYISTGSSHDVASTVASVSLLKIPMYAGIFMVIAGAGLFFVFKNAKWSLTIAAIGVGMIVGSYLLAQYAMYFMIGLVALLGYGVFVLYRYWQNETAAKENTQIIQMLRKTGKVDDNEFKEIANAVQSKTTKKAINRIKKENEI